MLNKTAGNANHIMSNTKSDDSCLAIITIDSDVSRRLLFIVVLMVMLAP